MHSWFTYLKQGLSRKLPKDRIAEREGYSGLSANLGNLRPFAARHWRKALVGIFVVLCTSVLGLPQPLIARYLIDRVILSKQLQLLAGTILLLIGIALAEKVLKLLQDFYFNRFEQEILLDIQHDLLERALRFPKSFFDGQETGYLMSRLSSDVQGLRWFFSSTLVYLLSDFLQFAGGVGLLFYLEWRLALVVVLILPALFVAIRYFSQKVYVLGHQSMEQQASVSSRLQESLSAVSLIKAFSSERRTVRRVMTDLKAAMQTSMEQTTVSSTATQIIHSMPGIAKVAMLVLGAYWVIRGDWTLGSLFAFQAYLGYVFGPAQSLAVANLQLQNARAALERVSALFDIVPEENLGRGQPVDHLKGEIEFREVSFSYDRREPVLKEISFRAGPGERVAIVGPSGVGKTTLVSLLLRFYKPNTGEIYFDGRPASEYELGSLRKRMGYVSQSPVLLSGTLRENLSYGNPTATQEQIEEAARAAGIHEFIVSLPEGYDSTVGERGVNLSEGQKQRLSIARALINDPDILVLDEPTSALDSLTEKSVFEALPAIAKDKTLFVVAHRFSTVRDSDQILLLNEKRLVAIGTHRSLLETSDYYRTWVAYQQANPETEQSYTWSPC